MRYRVTMTEHEPPERMVSTGLRLPQSLLDRLGVVARANRRTRADMHRVLLEDAIAAAERSIPLAEAVSHTFNPRPGNALKCETCGKSRGTHR